MSFFDWILAGIAATIGWALAPFLIVAALFVLAGAYVAGAAFYYWCKRAICGLFGGCK